MSANNPLHISAVRASRAACACAGLLLLLLQLLGPALASPGQSMWVEICSEAGAVWVEVALNEESQDPTAPCPKCADCMLCTASGEGLLPELTQIGQFEFVQFAHYRSVDVFNLNPSDRLWPETRGPPRGPEIKPDRAPRASTASLPVFGGAPCS